MQDVIFNLLTRLRIPAWNVNICDVLSTGKSSPIARRYIPQFSRATNLFEDNSNRCPLKPVILKSHFIRFSYEIFSEQCKNEDFIASHG